MAAAALDVAERAKWEFYEHMVAKLPKKDRRDLSRASEQTKWIMQATSEWYGFYFELARSFGLPTENVLYRAGLLIPRAPLGNTTPKMPEPSAKVAAVELAMTEIRESRRRVLIAVERFSSYGIDRAAHHLRMSPESTKDYLKDARQSLADIMRGMGWKIPQNE